jgi:hypothetical protein
MEMLLLCEKISDNAQPRIPTENRKTLQAVKEK